MGGFLRRNWLWRDSLKSRNLPEVIPRTKNKEHSKGCRLEMDRLALIGNPIPFRFHSFGSGGPLFCAMFACPAFVVSKIGDDFTPIVWMLQFQVILAGGLPLGEHQDVEACYDHRPHIGLQGFPQKRFMRCHGPSPRGFPFFSRCHGDIGE